MEFTAKTLSELLSELKAMTNEQKEDFGSDYSSLPVFGEYDGDTSDIYSWDKDSFLMVDGNGEWCLEDRAEFDEWKNENSEN